VEVVTRKVLARATNWKPLGRRHLGYHVDDLFKEGAGGRKGRPESETPAGGACGQKVRIFRSLSFRRPYCWRETGNMLKRKAAEEDGIFVSAPAP